MKYFSIIACIFGLYLFACADITENDCTDDGCPEFKKLETPMPNEDIRGKLDIEQWLESPNIELVKFQPINLEYGIHKVVQRNYKLPEIDTSANENFVK